MGEIYKIRKELNLSNKISFTPNFCFIDDYVEAFKYNNLDIVIDNINVIVDNLDVFRGKKIGLRLDLNLGHGHHDKVITQGDDSKFGITFTNFLKYLPLLFKNEIKIIGIHTHMGSGINNYKFWVNLLESIRTIIYQLKSNLKNLEWINIGGGFGINKQLTDNFVKLNDELGEIKNEINTILGKEIELRIEPGRYIIAKAGYVVGRVTQLKSKNNTNFIGCNIGMNDIIRPALYNSLHPIKFISINNIKTENKLVNLVGPVCESGDILIKNLQINNMISINDLVIVFNTGAYCESMASNYNSRKKLPSIIYNKK